MTDWRRRRDEERRRAEPYPNIAAGMAVAPNPKPLTGSACDAWQYDLAVSPLWDRMQATRRPPLSCWYCTGEHYTDDCEEAR